MNALNPALILPCILLTPLASAGLALIHQGLGRSRSAAHAMLALLEGRTHQVVTGVSLIHLRGHRERMFAVSTNVTFLPLKDEQIENYLNRINPLDKAGGYAIQEHGELIVSEISGSYSNVVGLPLERLAQELEAWGV